MLGNFSVYQLSQAYHVLRERLLVQKMLAQVSEEVLLIKYEPSVKKTMDSLENSLAVEVANLNASVGVNINKYAVQSSIVENSLGSLNRAVFENGVGGFSPGINRYLIHGPYLNLGEAAFKYEVSGVPYDVKARGYGVPVSNFNLVFYDLPSSKGGMAIHIPSRLDQEAFFFKKDDWYTVNEGGSHLIFPAKGDISYKCRKDMGLWCNFYEFLWETNTLESLYDRYKTGESQILLNITFCGEITEPGITFNYETREVVLDVGKIERELVTISDPTGEATIKIKDGGGRENPLTVMVYNNSSRAKQTRLEINESTKRSTVFYVLNTELVFNGAPQVKGAFFLDPNSSASGSVYLDGHFSCYAGAHFLDALDLKFNSTSDTKLKLASVVPHAFLTEIIPNSL